MSELKMLAIDLGASSGRGIIGKFDGNKFTLEENHRFPSEPVTIAGSFNWDIMRIFHEIKQAINKCALSDDRDIKTIGIDTWGVDYGLLDKHGKLLTNPVHYRDTRTVGIMRNSSCRRSVFTTSPVFSSATSIPSGSWLQSFVTIPSSLRQQTRCCSSLICSTIS